MSDQVWSTLSYMSMTVSVNNRGMVLHEWLRCR